MRGEGAAPGRRGEITGGPWYDEAWLLDHYPEALKRLRARLENGEAVDVGTFYGYDAASGADSTAEIAFSLQPRAVNGTMPYPQTDEWGMSEEEWRWERWEYEQERLRDRWKALKALWLRPVPSKNPSQYVANESGRGDDWTFWRAICATIGVVLDLAWTDAIEARSRARRGFVAGIDMAYWDARSLYGGYAVSVLWLYPRCRVSIFSDGETFL